MKQRSTSHAQRVQIVREKLAGHTLKAIAEQQGLHFDTVRKWWRRYRDKGWPGLAPKPVGRPARGPLSSFDPLVKYVVLRLKRQHPGWGLDVLGLHLTRRASLQGRRLPGRSSLHNYLSPFYGRLRERRRRAHPQPAVAAAAGVHECWQMDFKGEETVAGLGKIRAFIVCDEFTSAPLAGIIHTGHAGQRDGLTCRDIQADLRQVFAQWGLPRFLRMDRDPLWIGSTRLEWPGVVLLWLAGLGVTPVVNRAYRPTDNARVERCNRTWFEHVFLGQRCHSVAEFQAATDAAWHDRRCHLPSRNVHCAGRPPLVACPELAQPARPFDPQREHDLFAMHRVHLYLSQWQWQRKVDSTGSISLADHNRRVGKHLVGQKVEVRFDPQQACFQAFDVAGVHLRSFTLPVVSQDYIVGQGVCI